LFSRNDDGNIHSKRVALKDTLINLSQLRLHFFGFNCVIESHWVEILWRLERDFSAFKKDASPSKIDLYLLISEKDSSSIALPANEPHTSRSFVKTYFKDPILVNDYKSEVRSQLNLSSESAHVASLSLHGAHEVCYLLILSRIGKMMELASYHKIHAMGVVKNGKALCLSMDSGGGKSTILQSLISSDSAMHVLSDDCPVVNQEGQMMAFPVRLGLSQAGKWSNHAEAYELVRMRHGVKRLLDIKHVPYSKPCSIADEIILVFAKRKPSQVPAIKSISKVSAFVLLIKPFFIGVGLPLILEYFWEPGFADFRRKVKIALSRLRSGIKLCQKAECYSLEINDDLEATKKLLREIF
jgi:hypothetical protein